MNAISVYYFFYINDKNFHFKCIQILEEEKKNLDNFMMRENKNALLQERRRLDTTFIILTKTHNLIKVLFTS